MTLLQIFISSRIIEEIEDKVNADLCATLCNFIVDYGCEIGCTADFEIGCHVTRILEFLLHLKNYEIFS